MKNKIGIIGVGHLGQYLIAGLSKVDNKFEFFLADPLIDKIRTNFPENNYYFTTQNQTVVEKSEIIILATRPDHVNDAINGLRFEPEQIVVSVAAGVSLQTLKPLVSPAKAVRALPISCVAINKSPVLIYPDNAHVRDLFSCVGDVHLLPNEDAFAAGTALVGAFYAWIFLLMNETTTWTANNGIDSKMARELVIQTIEGACGMAKAQDDMTLGQIWNTLATPGGISEQGANIFSEKGSIEAWSTALDAVTHRMKGQ